MWIRRCGFVGMSLGDGLKEWGEMPTVGGPIS